MRNRETLGNVIFADPTASEAIGYVSIGEKRRARKQLRQGRSFPDSKNVIDVVHAKQTNIEPEINPVVVYSARNELAITQPPQILKARDPQTVRITELNQQLALLWTKKHEGQISNREYRTQQQELASKLHEAERQRGHKPIRTKRKSP